MAFDKVEWIITTAHHWIENQLSLYRSNKSNGKLPSRSAFEMVLNHGKRGQIDHTHAHILKFNSNAIEWCTNAHTLNKYIEYNEHFSVASGRGYDAFQIAIGITCNASRITSIWLMCLKPKSNNMAYELALIIQHCGRVASIAQFGVSFAIVCCVYQCSSLLLLLCAIPLSVFINLKEKTVSNITQTCFICHLNSADWQIVSVLG